MRLRLSTIFFLLLPISLLWGNEGDSLLKRLEQSQEPKEKVELLLQLSKFEGNNNSLTSIEFAQEAINIADEIDDKSYLMKSYHRLGISYKRLDSLDKALQAYLKVLSTAKKYNNKKWQINALNSLGTLYMKFKQNPKALSYYLKSYDLAKSIRDTVGLCNVLNNIGIIHWQENNLDSSIRYIKESLHLSTHLNDSAGLISSYNNLAMLESELGNEVQALGYFNQAYTIATNLGDKWETANIINNRSVLNINLGLLDDVQKDLQQAIGIAKSIDSKLLESDSYRALSDYYIKIGDYKKALSAFKKCSKLGGEVLNKQTSDKLAKIQKDYELRAKDRTLRHLDKENSLQFYLIVLLVISLMLLAVFMYSYSRKLKENKRISAELRIKNERLEKISSNRDKYFTLVSHDLKAPLYNISNLSNLLQMYAFSMSEEERNETLVQLGKSSKSVLGLIDNILLWAKTQAGTVENKPEDLNIKGLIAECIDILSPMASEKDITLVNQSEDISLQIDHNLLSASIRNLISNAIKFSNEGSSVVIKAEQVGDECQISVIDDGVGIEPERVVEIMDGGTSSTLGTSKEKGSGLGLRITKELIAMTGGNLTAESQWGKGSVFTISLPSK